jgi:hypothetical protein
LGGLPGAAEVRLALARHLAERGRVQEAELELLALVSDNDAQSESAAAAELLTSLDAKSFGRTASREFKWPRGQVKAETMSLGAGQHPEQIRIQQYEQQNAYRPLRIEQNFWPRESDLQWFLSQSASEVVGRNALGDDVFRVDVDQSDLPRRFQGMNSELVHASQLGHLLYLAVGGQVLAIDSRQDSPNRQGSLNDDDSFEAGGELLWPSRTAEEFSADALQRRPLAGPPSRSTRPPVYHTTWSGRRRLNGAVGSMSVSLGPVSPRGIVYQDAEELKCVDPLTGALLWARTSVPGGCELFGDDEFVFAVDAANHAAYVVRISNGEMVGKRDVPKSDWLLTAGRNVAHIAFLVNGGNRSAQITVTDIWTGKVLYQVTLQHSLQVSVSEPNLISVFEPSGTLRVIDVAAGKLVVDEKVDPVPDLQKLYSYKSGDDLFLFVSGQVQPMSRPLSQEFPLVNGPVFAYSLKTGKSLWPGPALVRNRGVVLQQPRGIPLLVFADRPTPKDGTNSGNPPIRTLCLDRRTGQTVYRNESLPEAGVPRFRVRGKTDSQPAVALEMTSGKIELTMTDDPRPPQPPGNDDLESPREIANRGLKALGQRIGDAFRGAMDQPQGAPGQRQFLPQRAVRPQLPAPAAPAAPQKGVKPVQKDEKKDAAKDAPAPNGGGENPNRAKTPAESKSEFDDD